tara:strand:+ start:167 stop:1948 length:1782 start_codon:yes stop_codon:yes gene_type:complete
MKSILYIILYFLISFAYAEQEKKYVSEIIFLNNKAFTSRELEEIVKIKSQNLFTRNEFTLKKYNRDIILLESFYKSKGFLDVDIKADYIEETKNYLTIKYNINEGSKFKLKELVIVGNKIFSDTLIYNLLSIKINESFNANLIRSQLNELKMQYLKNGKINVLIMDEVNIENTNVSVRINIFEGKTYMINTITISGLELVKNKYVLREIVFSEKDVYNVNDINSSRERIFDSGLFSSVEIIKKIVDKEKGLVNIDIRLREYNSSSIEATFGFRELSAFQENTSTTGIEANGRWMLGNLFNTTSNIELTGNIASSININLLKNKPLIEKNIKLIYTSPWTLYFRIPARFKYFHIEQTENDSLKRDGFTYSLIFDKDLMSKYEFNTTLEWLSSTDSSYSTKNKIEPSRWINFKYIRNKIIKPLNPQGGYYFSSKITLYGTILGGKRNFIKNESEIRKYINLFESNILAFRIILGYIKNLDTYNDLPNAYKFQLGGQTTLRGWSRPQEYLVPYGSIIDIMNIEYRFPIRNKIGGEIFFDAGRLYETINNFTSLKHSWNHGFGIVYQSALGPIRLDAGFPFGNFTNPQFHASLLYMF